MKHCKDLFLAGAIILILSFRLFPQGPDTLWTRAFGGTNEDYGRSVQKTSDGGYIIAGYTKSFGAGLDDVYLIKTDANGDTTWTKTYGGSNIDQGYSVMQTSDGGYIIAGNSKSFGAGLDDVYFIKTDANGDTTWTKTYGGSNIDQGYSVMQTSDGGYIIAGYTKSFGAGSYDIYLIKTDANGDTTWTKTYGGGGEDYGYSVLQTSDEGYIIAGYTESFGAGIYDVYLIKTDANGDTTWTKTYGGSNTDYGYSVEQISGGGYIIAGYTKSFGAGSYDVYLIKTDVNGDTLWTRTYGGGNEDYGYSVLQTSEGDYIIAGYTESFGVGLYAVYLIKTDSNGDTAWTKTYGGSNTDYGYSVVETSDDGCIIAGYTESFGAGSYDVYLAKTEPLAGIELTGFSASLSNEGILLKWRTECEIDNAVWLIERKNVDGEWKTITCIPSAGNSPMGANYSYTDKDVNFHNVYYYKLGSVDQNGKVKWFNTIKINPQTLGIPTTFTLNQNYPNPFSNRTTIKYQIPVATEVEIDICDVSGRHIKRLVNRVQKPGYYQTIWDGTNEGDTKTARGVYICRMRTNVSTKTKLLIRF